MDDKKNVVNKDYSKFTGILRVLGIILIITGIVLTAIAFMNMATNTNLFFLGFIGLPLIFVGAVCAMFGFMKKMNSFTASQSAPVQKDVTNYMLDGTREEMGKTAKEIFGAINSNEGSATATKKTRKCPSCGEMNDSDAKFCDNCGTTLVKVCPRCGEENDLDAKFCDKCGAKLY